MKYFCEKCDIEINRPSLCFDCFDYDYKVSGVIILLVILFGIGLLMFI